MISAQITWSVRQQVGCTSLKVNSSPSRYFVCVSRIHSGRMTGILCSTAYCTRQKQVRVQESSKVVPTRYLAESKAVDTTCVTVTVNADSIVAPSCLAKFANSALASAVCTTPPATAPREDFVSCKYTLFSTPVNVMTTESQGRPADWGPVEGVSSSDT